ncbi:MAG: 2-C-methyl-D-erythritol 4-phosphate cytidylyltransferase [Thermodesulfovibrionales bacterium]|jgi:2-C-methyl-D-erythritol 4-phosphate cytidylyltransferase|nr:2-C-methyl-D-erythritol 4-phosphate cytidylyltransferase [Thermodesulfovibrionales bacterium]
MKTKRDRVVAIVPAAGLGKRFGEEKNKPFYPLLKKPLIIWTLETLQGIEEIAEIIPVLKEDDLIVCGDLVEQYNITKVKRIVPGGQERQDSVYNALKILDDKTSVVLIHDGVRPLVEAGLIRKSLSELKDCEGVVVGVPVKDTIKEVESQDGLIVNKTLNRNILWAIQTPQVFFFEKIRDAYGKATVDKYYATDDSALIERYGGKVKVIMGSYRNIKITTPEDIDIAEALMKNI